MNRQTRGILSSCVPFGRVLRIVVMKLVDPRIDAPATEQGEEKSSYWLRRFLGIDHREYMHVLM